MPMRIKVFRGRARKTKRKQHAVVLAGKQREKCHGPDKMLSRKAFFEVLEELQTDLNQMRKVAISISELADKVDLAPISGTFDTTAKTTNPTNQLARDAKVKLSILQKAVGKGSGEAETRMRQNLLRLATKEFQEAVQQYRAAQERYKAQVQSKLERHVKILHPNATKAEVDDAIHEKGGLERLFQRHILAGGGDQQQVAAEKYRDVARLEASVAELGGMFLDVALLTDQQGELLNQIEYNVQRAKETVQDGNDNLEKSIGYQRSIRKKQSWITVIAIVVAAVLMIILL